MAYSAVFDANDPGSLQSFFQDLLMPIDHVMVTGPGPRYGPPLLERDSDQVRLALSDEEFGRVRRQMLSASAFMISPSVA